MSRINVDKITGATGTASGAPITLSGDTATLGSGVTMAANHSGVKTALNASGDAPIYACRAWVNFDGDSGSGTGSSDITIRGSGNVSSITDNGTGRFTVNFTTAMPDTDYVMAGSAGNDGTTTNGRSINRDGSWTTTAMQIRSLGDSSTVYDDYYHGIAVFR